MDGRPGWELTRKGMRGRARSAAADTADIDSAEHRLLSLMSARAVNGAYGIDSIDDWRLEK